MFILGRRIEQSLCRKGQQAQRQVPAIGKLGCGEHLMIFAWAAFSNGKVKAGDTVLGQLYLAGHQT